MTTDPTPSAAHAPVGAHQLWLSDDDAAPADPAPAFELRLDLARLARVPTPVFHRPLPRRWAAAQSSPADPSAATRRR